MNAMNIDIRLSLDFFDHPKTKKLKKRLGVEGIMAMLKLWTWAARNRPCGLLTGLDAEAVELAADWDGEEGAFVAELLSLHFLDEENDVFSIHDWEEHQAYASKSEERSSKAKKAAEARWSKAQEMPEISTSNAKGMLNDATSMQTHSFSNAPETRIQDPVFNIITTPIGVVVDGKAADASPPGEAAQVEADSTAFLCDSAVRDPQAQAQPCLQAEPALQALQASQAAQADAEAEAVGNPDTFAGTLTPALGNAESAETDSTAHNVQACPYTAIVAMYHEAFPEHPRVALLNAKRKKAIKARWADAGERLRKLRRDDSASGRLDYFRRLFSKAGQSDFLTGKKAFRDGSVYRVDFDKLMSPGGFIGVIEGKYDNRHEAEWCA